jgi:hypothetical protein
MHPVLLSLANIDAGVRMKATSRAFALLGYLPIPKFENVTQHEQSILKARTFHHAIGIMTESLKVAEANGTILSDPAGHERFIHTPLAAWIADYQEQLIIACVPAKQSPVTTASASQFGDAEMQPPRTRKYTLDRIATACYHTPPFPPVTPKSLEPFWRTCQALHLNGVHQPVWRDWGLACPSIFLTHDALHGLHKFFWDHMVRWALNIMKDDEFDQRLTVLQPRIGVRHWTHGISKLKQVTGREHRELEKVFIAVIAGGVSDDTLRAMRALLEFIFHAQDLFLYDETVHALRESLREFHHYKSAIIHDGGRKGKRGIIEHFEIPKLEMLHIIPRSTILMGAPYQWTSDITERCHITHVKTPYRMSNKRNFHEQCVRFMDRVEKMHLFGLYSTLKSHGLSLLNEMVMEASDMSDHYPEQAWLSRVLPDERQVCTSRTRTTFFDKNRSHISKDQSTAILLNVRPFRSALIEDIAMEFGLPDLRAALGDFYTTAQSYGQRLGRRHSSPDCTLPFERLNVWTNFRLQQRSLQDPRIISPHQTVQAMPPTNNLPNGRCNAVMVYDNDGYRLNSGDSSMCPNFLLCSDF